MLARTLEAPSSAAGFQTLSTTGSDVVVSSSSRLISVSGQLSVLPSAIHGDSNWPVVC